MDYLVLNEESIPYLSREDAISKFPEFIEIIDSASKERINTIRTEGGYGSNWFEFPLSDGYVVRNFLEEQERDYKRKIKSIISNTMIPIIPETEKEILARYELSEFRLTDDTTIETPSLGATHLLDQLALSFYSKELWNNHFLSIEKYEIDVNTGIESLINVNVRNITTIEHWFYFLEIINKERIESLIEGDNLWKNREIMFPNLVFCGKTESQFKKFNFTKNTMTKIIEILNRMNSFCEENDENFTVDSFKEKTLLNISKESETVLQNKKLKSLREFRNIDGKKEYFEWHLKDIPNTRLYFKFDFPNKQILIGYVGKHLQTKKY